MEICNSLKDWKKVRINTRKNPKKFPIIIYNVYTDFGIIGDGFVTHYHTIPKKFLINKKTTEIYVQGFIDGINKVL